MAFGCTFEPEGDEFFEWLMRNGYPELGALSQTIQGDTKAKDWLMEHGFPHLAAIDSTTTQPYGWKKTSSKSLSSSLIKYVNIWTTNT